MNILHHKSWHVRTKSNMERVRRDERKAAEEEQKVLDRQIQAENERRLNTLRARADDRITKMFGTSSSTAGKDVSISDETGHVNLFQDLEREERKNLGSGNKNYEEEKAKEKREWETKMGIQVYFADNTNDLNKKKEWYEEMPMRRAPDKETKLAEKKKAWNALPNLEKEEEKDDEKSKKRKKKKRKKEGSSSDEDEEDYGKKKHKDRKKKKKKRKHRDSSEERKLEEEYDREKKRKLVEMRDERLKRERAEKARTYALLHPEEERQRAVEEEEKNRKVYNSQFNPDFFRK